MSKGSERREPAVEKCVGATAMTGSRGGATTATVARLMMVREATRSRTALKLANET